LHKPKKDIYFVSISYPMQLLMYLGNDLIDSLALNFRQLSQPGYLGRYKRILKSKHAEMMMQSSVQPEFLVVKLAQSTNISQESSSQKAVSNGISKKV